MEMHAVGTTMINRKFFPDELKETKRHKKTMNRGYSDFRVSDNIVAMAWKDREPISFLSTFSDPTKTEKINRRKKDGTLLEINCPELVVLYNKYMGGTDKNDQLTRLNRSRRHYRWPRRLMMNFIFWSVYNAYIFYLMHLQTELPVVGIKPLVIFSTKSHLD
ncbi:hypothetical protein SNE40_013577 [Patella caerulea]|uniref:PiggyBac transposable element-derived protein domain-containing protein n=1 Tax=Patella caerulea TaxID=87958 RepID=A0AAN8JBW2_PATCE